MSGILNFGKRGLSQLLRVLLGLLVAWFSQVQAGQQTFIANGTWTAPAGVTSVTVQAWAGGGGGGGASGNPAKGGGGGGGGFTTATVTVVPATGYAVVVGAGGTVGATAAGGPGGNSSFASPAVVATGGGGGGLASANPSGGTAGAGGTGTYSGGSGSAGTTTVCTTSPAGNGGAGGGGAGTGGAGGSAGASGTASGNTPGTGTATGGGTGGAGRTTAGAGNPGATYGGGGGGGCTNAGTNRAGGLGGAGRVIVNWLPRLTSVTIASNNANTALAKVGDTVTLTFTASESVQATPTVTIAGHAVTPAPAGPGIGPYTATWIMAAGDTTGVVPFTINFTDLAGNAGTQVTATTNASSVTFDKTAPTLSSVTIASNNANTALAKVGDTVTLTFTASESVQATPTVTIAGHAVTPAPAGPGIGPYTATWIMAAGDTTGVVPFTINFTDLAGNVGTQVTATTNASSVTFDKTAPTVASINRADPDPTSAVSVSWTVTFSESVTGVDAADFALAPTGVSGAFITAVTGSGTTWTVAANTGIGSGTLGLNLTDNDTIIDVVGNPLGGAGAGNGNFTGQIYTITATPALAEYRMDEASWNGTAGEVVDSSGSGNHAQAFNSANTAVVTGQEAKPGDPGTCRYGVFDNGATITQGYVQTPLPNLITDFTVTAWIRTTNNTVGSQRILIDDQGTAPATGYGISLGDGGAGILRFYSRGITPVSLDSTYTVANNTWYFVAAVADITNKKRTIYVFNTAGTLLNSTTEAAWTGGAWGTDGGPVSIGAETNASAETPASNHFKGNLDEVRVYQKVLSQSALAAIATQAHACPINIPDHLEIQSSGSGLTCAASTLTIKACTDSAVPCAVPYTLGVSGTLSAAGAPTVNWDGTTGGATGAGFVIPNGSSTATKNVQVVTAGSVVFGITSPAPVPTNATACNFGAPACTFTANTAGFIFSNTTTGNSYTIPAQVSGIATSTLYLRAVQASTTNAAVCTPTIVGQTTAVNMGYVCNDPAVCQAGSLATINATAVASGGTAVTLTFDANGSAPITARYDDAGQITLNANKIVTPFGGGTAITLNGNSNAFVVKPDHFDLSGIQQTAAPNQVNPAATDATGNRFVAAGEQFSVTVTAKNALGGTTKNYGQETTAENVKLTSALVGGLGLTNNPAISGTFGAFSNGVATGTAFTWSEAGIITLTPSVADADYLGAGNITGTTSGNVGRFYAAKFSLSGGVIANRTDMAACPAPAGCGSFTYMGEQMSAIFNLTAKAVDGTTTLQNYNYSATAANNFAKLNPTAAGNPLVLGAVDTGTPRTVAVLDTTTYGVASGNFVSGVASVTAPFAVVRGGSASGPFDALDAGVNPADSDGATLATLNLAVNAGGAPNTHGMVGSTKARYGRIKVGNAYGSELIPLTMTATVQYCNVVSGTSCSDWKTSGGDSLTSISLATPFTTYVRKTGAGWITTPTPLLMSGESSPATWTVQSGVRDFSLSAPGVGNTGNVTVPTNAVGIYLPIASGQATFGVYQGRREFIYMRENH